jgi:protein ImuB
MFACIFSRSVSAATENQAQPVLVDLAFTFSPLVEQTTVDTVVLDIAGRDLMFGLPETATELAGDAEIYSAHNLAMEIARRARQLNLEANVSVAANPDAAIHVARSFKTTTIVKTGEELSHLGTLSLKKLDYSLAGIDAHRAAEIGETFALWGVRTFDDLARLPLAGVAERLGQDGVRLQKLAQGKSDRPLNLIRPPVGFEQSMELEHPIEELEPLSFILSRLLNQLCANLLEHALATNELQLLFVTEPGADRGPRASSSRGVVVATGLRTQSEPGNSTHERTITLPVPMRNSKNLLRLLLLDIEAHPPSAAILAVTIKAEPVKPRAAQTGLFIPLAPEPERLEITLARLAKLVGANNLGSPELLDTHRPDAFRMKRFCVNQRTKRNVKGGSRSSLNAGMTRALPVLGFRVFRPPWHAEVHTMSGRPVRINARANSSGKVRGKIVCASGPWRTSGEWWRADVWARDEWDVAVSDSGAQESEVLCRIYRDLANEQWFVAGVYD